MAPSVFEKHHKNVVKGLNDDKYKTFLHTCFGEAGECALSKKYRPDYETTEQTAAKAS